MTDSMVGIRRLLGVTSPLSGPRERAPFGPALVLTVALAAASFLIVMSVIWVVDPPHRLPGYFAAGGDQNQGAKTALYVLAFAVILPLALAAVPRLADAIAAGPNALALPVLSGLVAGTLAAALLLVRLSALLPWGDGTGTVLVAVGVWGAATTAMLRRAAQPRPWPALLSLAPSARAVMVLAGALVFGLILCVTALHTLSLLPIVLGVLVAAAVLAAGERVRLPRVAGRLGIAADIVLGLLLILAIPDLLVFDPGIQVPTLLNVNGVMQFHHDFLLGPANQVLRGGVLMADEPVSQWGVGPIYLLAAWFHIAPIGYGTYALLDGILTALLYGAAYCLLRVAGVTRVLAAATLAVAVAVLVYNLHYPVGGLPQQGPLRFGLPMAVVLPAVVAARWPRHARAARVLVLIALGVASVWALEGFAYTLLAFAAMACTEAALRPAGERKHWLVRQGVLAVAAFACAHLTFALATFAASGKLPAWGQYLAFVHAFLLGGKAGGITYGFARWSPGVAVAGAYLASAAAIVLLIQRRPELARRERTTLIALAGTTAWGVGLFSYFDNRSATYLLLYVALPALLMGGLWISLLLRSAAGVSGVARKGGLAFVLCLAILLLSAAWTSIGDRFTRTPLAEAFPGGHGLRADLRRLWHLPPLNPRSPEGQRLLSIYMPSQRHVLMMVSPDLGTEILIRSGRASQLPIGDPIEESFVASSRIPVLRDAIAKLQPGERMLLDQTTWRVARQLRAKPTIDPLREFQATLQAPLQAWVLQRVERRFTLRPIHADSQGFVVVELDPRR